MARDVWDKADIVGKLISGAALAIIALVIKLGADDIATSQREGELVVKVMTDLTTKDSTAKQDLALIALNHSVSKRSRRLVIDIADRLLRDTTGFGAGELAVGAGLNSVAFGILRQRDSVRAKALERYYLDTLIVDKARDAVITNADTSIKTVGTVVDSNARAVTELLAPFSSNVVYIQFRGSLTRGLVDTLRQEFAKAGLTAPGAERKETTFTSSVRYFHAQDKELADSITRMTTRFTGSRGIDIGALPVQDLSGRGFRARRGQIEVWINRR
jgi:hypothetical protein